MDNLISLVEDENISIEKKEEILKNISEKILKNGLLYEKNFVLLNNFFIKRK